jgi:valyl-tRNA synthetase
MPFITEELWQNIGERPEGATIMFAPTPKAGEYDEAFIRDFETARETVVNVRSIRNQKNLSPKEPLALKVKAGFPMAMAPVVEKLASVSSVEQTEDFGDTAAGVPFIIGTVELFVPLTGLVNVEEEIAKVEADLAYQRIFLEGVRKKLSNESFVAHAPEKIVAVERKKEADALSRIESLESQLNSLKSSK